MGTVRVDIGPYVRGIMEDGAKPYADFVRRLHEEHRISEGEVESLRQAVEQAQKEAMKSMPVVEPLD